MELAADSPHDYSPHDGHSNLHSSALRGLPVPEPSHLQLSLEAKANISVHV